MFAVLEIIEKKWGVFSDEYLMYLSMNLNRDINFCPISMRSTLRKYPQTRFYLSFWQGKMCRIRISTICMVVQMDSVSTKLVEIVLLHKKS